MCQAAAAFFPPTTLARAPFLDPSRPAMSKGQARRRRARPAAGSDGEAEQSPASSPPAGPSHQKTHVSSSDDDMPEQIVLKRRQSSNKKSGKGKHKYTYSVDAPGSNIDDLDFSQVPFLTRLAKAPSSAYRRLFLAAGILIGASLMFFFAPRDRIDAQMQNAIAVVQDQFGIDLRNLSISNFSQNDFTDISDRLFAAPKEWLRGNDFTTGRALAAEGYKAKHPVVLVPGIISTGLESWSTGENEQGNFRQRLWGTSTMMRSIVFDKEGWVNQIKLDEDTGLDPPGIRVRAAQGLDAADYFITGYWIWQRVYQNLAAIGYDPGNLFLAGYDWRLSVVNLEERDRYFTRLMRHIEVSKRDMGLKTVLVSHSMGTTVMFYFLKWVEARGPGFGNGGPRWVEDHIESFVSIGGTYLGVPKAMAALFTGEMRDTVELPPPAAYLLEKFFSREERVKLFRGWSGSSCMLLKGGSAVWGGPHGAPDDPPEPLPNSTAVGGGEWRADNVTQNPASPSKETLGMLYNFRASPPLSKADQEALGPYAVEKNISAEDALPFLLSHAPSWYQQSVYYNYSNGIEYDAKKIAWNGLHDPRTWTNPLEVALPYAPSMKMVVLYGEGKPTERAYWIEHGPFKSTGEIEDNTNLRGECENCPPFNASDVGFEPQIQKFPSARPAWIDNTVQTLGTGSGLGTRAGCRLGEGDGTVSLLSLGSMAAEGWKRKRYNPAGIKVIVHEVKHQPDAHDLRGGTTTGDHVDILGSWSVNENVLKAAAGRSNDIVHHVSSDIEMYAKKIYWDSPPPAPINGSEIA